MMKYFFLFTLTLLANQAHAWLHLEPIVGYNRGQEQGSQLQGIGFGARIGIDFNSIFIVADAGYHTVQQGSINQATYNDTGLTVGGKIRNYRIWYGLISSASYSYSSGGSTTNITGTGSKVGLSTDLSDKMSLNLETRFYNFTQSNGAVISEIGTVGFLSLSWNL